MKYLHAYIIDNEAVGVEKTTWLQEDLNGNEAFISTDNSSETGYKNISSIVNWDNFFWNTTATFNNTRAAIQSIVDSVGFENLSMQEKKIAAKWLTVDESTRNSILTEEEKKKFAKDINAAMESSPIELTDVEDMINDNDTNAVDVKFDIIYNSSEGTFNSKNTNRLKLDTLNGDSSLYQISGDKVIIQEDGEYIISAEITLVGVQHTIGGEVWIDINGLQLAGAKAAFSINKNGGMTSSISMKINLLDGDEISLYNNRTSGKSNKTYKQPSHATRLLIRKK